MVSNPPLYLHQFALSISNFAMSVSPPSIRHFLKLDDFSSTELEQLIDRAIELKAAFKKNEVHRPLLGKTMAMIFSKSSTRTRVSFETAMVQLGGAAINLIPSETQIGRGEPIRDTARVLSSMVDAIMMRTDSQRDLTQLAEFSRVPVINGLTDDFHPCQILADIQTFTELRGSIKGAKVAWIGDGNNVCQTFISAAPLFGFELKVATPDGYQPALPSAQNQSQNVILTNDPMAAIENADLVVTDTWASMGQEEEKTDRIAAFKGYCVTQALMQQAHKDALFMHCLPAYRGFEVSDSVIEGPQSAVFAEAENRLHAQKALLEFLLA